MYRVTLKAGAAERLIPLSDGQVIEARAGVPFLVPDYEICRFTTDPDFTRRRIPDPAAPVITEPPADPPADPAGEPATEPAQAGSGE